VTRKQGSNLSLGAVILAAPLLVSAANEVVVQNATLPEAPASAAIKKVPRTVLNAPSPKRFSLEALKAEEDLLKREDEITVFGLRDPEDVVSAKKPPILALRATLEKQKNRTPADWAKMALAIIGLGGANYGPEGIPVEDKTFSRGESGAKKTSIDLLQQFRGTLQ